ncbi:hypothetical protein Ancab_032462 [Ancistrocladus abbreviatus]
MPYLALFMLLFLPVHACIALRPLDDIGGKARVSGKDVENSKLQEVVSSLKVLPSFETEERSVVCASEAKDHGSQNRQGATTMKLKELKANPRILLGTERKILGKAIVSSAPEIATMLEETKFQSRRLRGIGRPTSESASHHSNEPADSSGGDQKAGEDVVEVMDYAQPHRKPPIHNHKP